VSESFIWEEKGQVLSLPRLEQFASHKVYSVRSLFVESFMFS
jgi:hypothetical protein